MKKTEFVFVTRRINEATFDWKPNTNDIAKTMAESIVGTGLTCVLHTNCLQLEQFEGQRNRRRLMDQKHSRRLMGQKHNRRRLGLAELVLVHNLLQIVRRMTVVVLEHIHRRLLHSLLIVRQIRQSRRLLRMVVVVVGRLRILLRMVVVVGVLRSRLRNRRRRLLRILLRMVVGKVVGMVVDRVVDRIRSLRQTVQVGKEKRPKSRQGLGQ